MFYTQAFARRYPARRQVIIHAHPSPIGRGEQFMPPLHRLRTLIAVIAFMRMMGGVGGRGPAARPMSPTERVVEREVERPPAEGRRVVEREIVERDPQDPNPL